MDNIRRYTLLLLSSRLFQTMLTAVICVLAFFCIPKYYRSTLSESQISLAQSCPGIKLEGNLPIWFSCSEQTYYACHPISEADKQLLCSLVSKEDSLYSSYCMDIQRIAYLTNSEMPNLGSLLLLTLCFTALGCGARSFYNFIGRTCYKKNQEMDIWWPWYFYRLFICIPIASFLLVAARSSMLSSLFTSKDLNTYLVIAFLAGFSMIEFLTMLRRMTKGLFEGGENDQKGNG